MKAVASLATLYTGCIPITKVCTCMDKTNIMTTFSIHVATANTRDSYMTVPGLLIAACGCVVDYCTSINSPGVGSCTIAMHGCTDAWTGCL